MTDRSTGDAARDREPKDYGSEAAREAALDSTRRDRYRDDDDQRDRLGPDERMGTSPDTKSEASGSARVNVGNSAHDQKDRDLEDRNLNDRGPREA